MSLRYLGRRFSSFQQVLILIITLIIAVIIIGTAAAFLFKKANPRAPVRKSDPAPEQLIKDSREKTAVYTGLGQLRAVTSDNPPAALVLTPYFPYELSDSVLYEEIVQKNRKIRALFLDYFARNTKRDLQSRGELAVKADLLQLINEELIMGKISQLYFTEYIFL